MKNLKILFVLFSFGTLFQCASHKNMDKMSPVDTNASYFQEWIEGREEGSSGFTVSFIAKEDAGIVLKYAYFKGKKIGLKNDGNLYRGKYAYANTKMDLIMSDDPKEEFKNTVPAAIEEKIPFELKGNECVIVYSKNGKESFFKIKELPQKKVEAMPNRQKQ